MSTSARCVVVGEAALTLQCSNAILEAGSEVVGVFTKDPALLAWAKGKGIPAHLPESLPEFAELHSFDYLFSIVNGRIIPEPVLAKARMAAINFHDGPLPRYAGFFSTTWALLNRELQYGVTWHRMTGDIDAGEIVCQRLFPVTESDTAFTLNAKCYEAGLISFADMIREIANGSLSLINQDLSQRTYFPRWDRPSPACLIPFDRSCAEVDAFCRALDFGPYLNPMGLPKILLGATYYGVTGHTVSRGEAAGREPGTILRIAPEELAVALPDGSIAFRGVVELTGQPVEIPALVARHNVQVGDWLLTLPADTARRVSELHSEVARHEAFWVKRLARLNALRMGAAPASGTAAAAGEPPSRYARHAQPCPAEARALLQRDPAFFEAASVAFLARASGGGEFSVGLGVPLADAKRNLFSTVVPMEARVDPAMTGSRLIQTVREEIAALQKRRTYLLDLPARYPELRAKAASGFALPVVLSRRSDSAPAVAASGCTLHIQLAPGAEQIEWFYDERVIAAAEVERWSRQFANALTSLVADLDRPLSNLSLMSEAEVRQAITGWNQTRTGLDSEQRIHCLFEAQARRTPDAIAVSFEGQDLTYRQLDERSNQLARLLRERGAGAGKLVAISTDRSLAMIVGLLGILKSGAAYVPMDASYPAERLSLMLEDSQPCLLLTEERLLGRLPSATAPPALCLDRDWPQAAALPAEPLESGVTGDGLAYVIYTSGSTGRPKGVMLTHSNVANFFAGMDQSIGGKDGAGVWLAVTSISFDISVLELFWTLARGFRVVIVGEDHKRLTTTTPAAVPDDSNNAKDTAFSLFYFAAYDSTDAEDPYRLLLEGAKFADAHGFEAVWTPERHFHSFGGLYPNPSVTSAALAAITRRVKIRAGSAVLPLHHPVRLAEEWAFVDRLSGGRTGISFAAGWHQRDFILSPGNYAAAKDVMFREIETVRKLWRGEAVTFPDGKGTPAEIRILPRPAQAELPVWITAAGNVETFRMAGERGFNLLTHLLGQSIDQLTGKIAAYRDALAAGGRDPASGKVTLMLHTFVGESLEEVRETVRTPFTNYLKSSVDLIKNSPWSFPAFAKPGVAAAAAAAPAKPLQLTDLAPADLQALLDHSFDRYFESSGLFGTVDDCVRIVEKLKAIGVDEIGCLVDFGVDTDTVLDSLRLLKEVMNRVQKPRAAVAAVAESDHSLAAQMARYEVTHLQCTPSMAGMLVAEPRTRQALGRLHKLLVGGEALPSKLAERLLEAMPPAAAIHNMYGPTETTVWSTTARVSRDQSAAVIGRPIANTQIYLLDANRKPVPVGSDGEIYIGGLGVARGYWNRPDLTADRFVEDPFRQQEEPGSRMYRTGDLARYLADGRIEYVGRIDHQVKIRGFRIELGEIENALLRHQLIKEAVVVARDSSSGGKSLAAYYVSRTGEPVRELKPYLEGLLPAVMIPSAIVRLDAMPLTPNGKIDRNALPEPNRAALLQQQKQSASSPAAAAGSVPANRMEGEIAAVWREVLGLEGIGMSDNFFDLGAHSILMVQAHVQLKERLQLDFSMIDLFQFPTVRSLASHLAARAQPSAASAASGAKLPSSAPVTGSDRASARKAALARRPPLGA